MRYTRDLATGTDRHGMDKRVNQHHPPVHARQRGEDDHISVLCSVARCNVSPLRGRFCKEHTPRFETDPHALPKWDAKARREDSWVFDGREGLASRSLKKPFDLRFAGRRLRKERDSLGLTRRQVAKSAGLTDTTIRRLESGQPTHLVSFLTLLQFYDLEPNEVLRRKK